jgi:hypothetical protein
LSQTAIMRRYTEFCRDSPDIRPGAALFLAALFLAALFLAVLTMPAACWPAR